MRKFLIDGMNCASCSARVEKAVKKLNNVRSCSVNLLTNSMTVEGSVSDEEIITAVVNAGYGARIYGKEKNDVNLGEIDLFSAQKNQTKKLLIRLIISLSFLIVLVYFSMGCNMWGFPIPTFFEQNRLALALLQLILCVIILIINQKFFIKGVKGLLKLSPNMDSLVCVGSGSGFIYSIIIVFLMCDCAINGNITQLNSYSYNLYFESSAMILVLITFGKLLESYSKGKTTNAIKGLMDLRPKTATIIIDGKEKVVGIENVKLGDIFLVKPGESIPVDGKIIEGASSVNQSAITGESLPIDKNIGDSVTGATINQDGYLKCVATRVGQDTTISQIIQMVSDASSGKAPISRIADKVSGIFVPVVMALSIITLSIWLILGYSVGFSLEKAISVLVVSCPCSLGLATPVAIMVGNGVGAKNGILYKTAAALEEQGRIKTVVLDKTGTITLGKPIVTDLIVFNGFSQEELLIYASSLEKNSEHPYAKAILDRAEKEFIKPIDVNDFKIFAGNGLSCKIDEFSIYGGNYNYIASVTGENLQLQEKINNIATKGKTPLIFAMDGKIIGIIAVRDEIKKDSRIAISKLKELGIKVLMVTGDNEITAQAIAKEVCIDEVIASVLPEKKGVIVKELQKNGKVLMVGDGINDAPALTQANVGVAIGAGSDIAIDSADVVLVNSKLSDVVKSIKLSKKTLTNIYQNLFWAFIYNMVGIPIAAGVFTTLGFTLNPMICALAMGVSSFCVVMNSLRLNFANIGAKKVKRIKKKFKLNKTSFIVEGMMCKHCEAKIKEVIQKLPEIEVVEANHKNNLITLYSVGKVKKEVIKKLIEDEGYKFIDK